MEDIDNLLEQFKQKAEAALEKKVEDYPSFKDLEKEYFDLINGYLPSLIFLSSRLNLRRLRSGSIAFSAMLVITS